ncbi:hypothetical protein DVH24_040107 [Malus domestica]|uniref:HMG box domain-containing protein n=1 Tax=Malus domestica TaxID=3750 RepID=A0A498I3M1_MALDO|nr:hypothetical protein DVH24_040107 [Malus domestica]
MRNNFRIRLWFLMQIKKENPEADFKENVSPEEKRPYEERYQVEKEAYLQVTAKEKSEQEAKKENKKSKKEKDPWKPKHPMSAFFLFTNDRLPALAAENKTVTEIAKITGEEWKNMAEEQKLPYEEMTRKNKEKYIQEMEAYKEMKEEEASNLKKEKHEVLQLLKKKEKTENIVKLIIDRVL